MATSTDSQTPRSVKQADELPEQRRPMLLLAVAAGLCWACAVALLLSGDLRASDALFSPPRVLFYALVLCAGLLTFVPAQRLLRLPGLAFEGVAGTSLLFYTLAFVPPPTSWLLELPEMPVYLLFIAALFWSVSAIALPLVHSLGRRYFRQRARQFDLRRARRQAHEVGALMAAVAVLAALRLFTVFSLGLLVLILVVVELLFLSFVEAET